MVTIREYGGPTTRRRTPGNRRTSSRAVVPYRGGQVAKSSGPRWVPSPLDVARAIWRNRKFAAGVMGAARGDFSGLNSAFKKGRIARAAESIGSLVGAGNTGRRIGNAAQANADRARSLLGKRSRNSGGGLALPSGPGIRRLPPNAPPIGSQSNMRGKKRVRYGGATSVSKFRRGKRTKLSSVLTRGACLKGETQVTVTNSESVYFGHNSHPIRASLRAIGLAIVRLLMKKWGQDAPDFQSAINGDVPSPGSAINCTIIYRVAFDGLPLESTFDSNNGTWVALADNIMHRICSLCTASLTYFEILELKFRNSSTATLHTNNTVVFQAKKLKIKVSGRSTLKVQNVTVGASGEAITEASADEVAANPLQGKMYHGSGQYHTFTFTQDQTLTAPIIRYDPDNGDTQFTPTTTDLSTVMGRVLKKPPPYKAFTHMSGETKIKLMPGQIKTSSVKTKYTLSLNQWIYKMMNVLRTGANLGAITNAGMCNLGKSCLIGLEHVVKSPSGEADVTVHYQADWTVSAIASYFKARYCNPVYDVATSSVIV